jgi:carbamoyl-phosphate synthase, small subunit
MNELYLILEDGTIIKGKSFGYSGEATGELVFTTAMTGYIETLTDPSYYGQIVIQSFPLIGNYGIINEDFESDKPAMSAYIVREYCDTPSNFRCNQTLDEYLKQNKIIGMYDVDTRGLIKKIRSQRTMAAKIVTSLTGISDLKEYKITDSVNSVSVKHISEISPIDYQRHIVLWDFGAKANIIKSLTARNCRVTVVPADTTAVEIIDLNPDGVMLSNGPGDPAENINIISEIRKLISTDISIFGICLGHQLIALASGGETYKLKYGHRGANHPVKSIKENKVYITSQNHGYAVDMDSIPNDMEITWINVNDNTCEGLRLKTRPVYTVQFHPEACGGPHDTMFLFDDFIKIIDTKKGLKYAVR